MKNFGFIIIAVVAAALVLAGDQTVGAWPTWLGGKPSPPQAIESSQLPKPADQNTADWVAENIRASGFEDRVEEVVDTARVGLGRADKAIEENARTWDRLQEVADTARTAHSLASKPRGFDFKGKTLARIARDRAIEFTLQWAEADTAAPAAVHEIARRLKAGGKLSDRQEEIVAMVWLDFIQSRVPLTSAGSPTGPASVAPESSMAAYMARAMETLAEAKAILAEAKVTADSTAAMRGEINALQGRADDLDHRLDATNRNIADVALRAAQATDSSIKKSARQAANAWLYDYYKSR